jgi:hypothetical protein
MMSSGGDNDKRPCSGSPHHNKRPQGWMYPSVRHRHQLGGFLLCASACLYLLLVVMVVSAC